MPFLGGSDSSTDFSSKRASIQFAPTLVTGVSRPVNNEEQWTLYRFERHACKCTACHRPLRVQQENRKLCSTGRDLATEVASLLWRLRSDGHIYHTSKSEHQEIRIEIPTEYKNVVSLFQAIKIGGKGFLRAPVSYDRTYLVPPRIPSRPQQQVPHEWHGVETVRPRSSHRKHKKSKQALERMSRGSLYYDDIAAQRDQWYRESQLPLNLEVQQPYTPIYSRYR